MLKDEDDIIESMNIDAGCEFAIVIDTFEERDDADAWFLKTDFLKYEDSVVDVFEEIGPTDDWLWKSEGLDFKQIDM